MTRDGRQLFPATLPPHRGRISLWIHCRADMSRGMERSGTKVEAPLNSCAMMRRLIQSETYNRRLGLMTREVLLAVAVTIAAVVFIFLVSAPAPLEQAETRLERTVQK